MRAEYVVWLGAVYHVVLAGFHLTFWKLFRWREELPRLGAVNRGVMQVMNLMLTYVFFVVAGLEFAFAEEFAGSVAGRTALAAIAGFWTVRSILQPIFWVRSRLSWAFAGVFAVGAVVHVAAMVAALA